MRLVSKGNVICRGHKEVLSTFSLSEHGCGLPRISGSQPWSLGLGDSRFGSTFSSLLSESNFSFSDLREHRKKKKPTKNTGGFLWHREIQYFVFCVFTVNKNCTGNAKVCFYCPQRNNKANILYREIGTQDGQASTRPVQVLILVPNQSETEGVLLLFPTAVSLRKLFLTIFHSFFGVGYWDWISAITFSAALLCWNSRNLTFGFWCREWSLADRAAWLGGAVWTVICQLVFSLHNCCTFHLSSEKFLSVFRRAVRAGAVGSRKY